MIKGRWISLHSKQCRRCHGRWESNECFCWCTEDRRQTSRWTALYRNRIAAGVPERLWPTRCEGGNSCAPQCKTKLVNDLKNWPAIPDYLCVTARSLYWLHIFPEVQFLFKFFPTSLDSQCYIFPVHCAIDFIFTLFPELEV